mmetsp:Transcript_30665/g.85537  ORF Transcript_30665/g.85537 Transcript_30665/m.85537 type:complete len:230 (-) Transcript_30665:111-800(-)
MREATSLRASLDGIKSFTEELGRQVRELQADRGSGLGDALAEAAEELVEGAVSALGRRLEDGMRERLARCDAAAAGCERCAREVQERLRMVTDDLRRDVEVLTRLAEPEGGEAVSLDAGSVARGSAPSRVAMFAAHQALQGLSGAAGPLPASPKAIPRAFSFDRGDRSPAASHRQPSFGTEEGSLEALAAMQPQSPSGLLAAVTGKVAQLENALETLRRENSALRGKPP